MSEIKYPCAMMWSENNGLVVWFEKAGCGIVIGLSGEEKYLIGERREGFTMSVFKPYIRPKKYKWKYAYASKYFNTNISSNFYESKDDFKKDYPEAVSYERVEISKREVQ